MEWYSIEYLYPDSFKKFVEEMFPNVGLLSLSTLDYYDTKKLYQFFDKHGIYLTIEMYNPHLWGFSISLDNGFVLGQTKESKKTREDIECEGFFECFRILNERIKDKK